MRRSRTRQHAAIEPNLTSLIDVTFLLIVFFVLVSRLNEVEQVELDLPSPVDAATTVLEGPEQVIVSVLPGDSGEAKSYRVGIVDFTADRTGIEAMTARLKELFRANPSLNVNVRADRATHYEHVEPVMRAVSIAARGVSGAVGAARVNLMVSRDH